MQVRDSRRVPGLNVIWDRPCAVLDVEFDARRLDALIHAWEAHAALVLAALDWEPHLAVRRYPGGASLALAAPLDALLAATEVNEWACEQARVDLEGGEGLTLEAALVELRRAVARDKRLHKGLVRLAEAVEQRELSLFSDDDCTSIGMGRHSLSFATRALPALPSIDFGRVADIPVALVTGTNGKSTSVRMLGSMVAAAGLTAGLSSTDWVRVGDQVLEHGDYSGPSGARMVLRDQRVDVALLEFARGGIARRGVNVRRASVALITNVGADHLGEWGVGDLNALADLKFTLARAVQHGGALVLNADDDLLVRRAKRAGAVRLAWFSRDSRNPIVLAHLERGGAAAFQEQGALWYARGSVRQRVALVEELGFLFGGAAAHNVSNALGAIATAIELGLDAKAVASGLARFSSDAVDNPGRLNSFEFGSLRVLCDFAHNPHGMQALLSMIAALPAQRRLVVLGQAGDRDDASIRELARLSAAANPECIVVKEMPQHLRGRPAGAVVAMITRELERCGYPKERISLASAERDAVRLALQWAQAGDLLLLLLHAEREYVLQWMQRLSLAGWQPGEPIPG